MPVYRSGLISSDMQPLDVDVFYQLLFATEEGILCFDAGLYLPRQARSVSQRLSRKVCVLLQLPHRLSSSVCLVLKLALLRFLRLLRCDAPEGARHDSDISAAVPDDGSGDMAIALVLIDPGPYLLAKL